MEALGGAASVIAVIDTSAKILSLCGQYISAVKNAKEDIERLSREVAAIQDVLNRVKELSHGRDAAKLPTFAGLTKEIDRLSSELVDLEGRLTPGKRRWIMNRLGMQDLKWPFKREEVDRFITALGRHKTTISLALNTDQSRLLIDVSGNVEQLMHDTANERADFEALEQDRQLSKLPSVDAAFNSKRWEHKSLCLQNTRTSLLDEIKKWSKNASGPCIFWLNGMAGTGKSTVAFTIARACNDEKRLGASFFFSRGDGNLGNAAKFFTTLATQLANTLPDLKPHIGAAIKNNPDISQRGLAEQWKHLIFQPLCKLHQASHRSQPLVLVIDALDECGNEDDVQLIVRLLAESTTARLRVFLTSRRETCIRLGFHTISNAAHHDFILHEIPLRIIQNDISLFLHHEFEIIRSQPVNNVPSEWPGDAAINDLCERAKGLFIYASTACRFIRDPYVGPEAGLRMVLQDTYRGLDLLYVGILRQSVIHADHIQPYQTEISRGLRQIVGAIVVLFDPLPLARLATLLAMEVTTVHPRLRCLHAVLDVPEDPVSPIRFLHPSFRDFLLDQKRCTELEFWIDEKKAHNDTLMNCLNLMSQHLKQDMCNFKLPGARPSKAVVENCIPTDVQYATRYWIHHLQYGDVELCDYERVHTFLRTHFLHWFETLGLIGKISDGVLMVRNLEAILTQRLDANNSLLKLVRDGKIFILYNRGILEDAPLQIYCSALVYCPKTSEIRRTFGDQIPRWIKRTPVLTDDRNHALQSLEGHSDEVRAVAFSPDGHIIASASRDHTVKLWDPSTGASRATLEGHSHGVRAVAFSPDGHIIASASDDKTVRLWDASTGASRATLEGHSEEVTAVAFSPDGHIIASASWDKTVRLWDPSTGASRATLEGHSGWVTAVVFSPDGHIIASASHDKTVRLWDPSTGASRATLEGHSYRVTAVAFSPDGHIIASASNDKTVRLWDASTGASRATLEGHSHGVTAVAFSPDGHIIASASNDKTVRLWDIETKEMIREFTTEEIINKLSFSSDGLNLHTNLGIMELERPPHYDGLSQPGFLCPLNICENWVRWRNDKILWLPPDYRARCAAVQHNLITIGHESGDVTFIEFDPANVALALAERRT